MLYNVVTKAGLMLLLTAPAPSTPNLSVRRDVMPENIQQLSLPTLAESKLCLECGERKPRTKFFKNNSKDGRSPRCRNCTDPPERQRERDRARYRDNPVRYHSVRMRVRGWAKHHPVQTRQYLQAYYQNNKPVLTANNRRYRKAHPEVMQVCRLRRRARLIAAVGVLTTDDWRVITDSYGSICLRCKRAVRLTVDHVVPLSKGGEHCACNIQPLCHSCNTSKRTRDWDYRPFLITFDCPHSVNT